MGAEYIEALTPPTPSLPALHPPAGERRENGKNILNWVPLSPWQGGRRAGREGPGE
jgi:hypothetical protein